MSSEVGVPRRKLPIVPLAVVAAAAIVGAVLLLRGVDPRVLLDQMMKMIRDAGPWVFFGAMAVLPAFGLPMMLFTIPAGEAFAPRMGMPAVIAVSLVVIAFNLALGYWVARYALRPVLMGVLNRYGYSVPRVTPENALSITLLVRLTPGPPYALQGFILGCAEVPFRLYMIVAWLGILPWAIGAIVLGRGLFSGNFGIALTGLGVLVAAAAAVHWVRRKYFRRVH